MSAQDTISQGDILKAVQDLRTELRADVQNLKGELSGSFQTGLSAVNLAVAALTEAHHRAVIEQEKRNAEFAQRTRVDELIGQVHGHSNRLSAIDMRLHLTTKQMDQLESCTNELDARMNAGNLDVTQRMDTATISMLRGTLGYIVLSAITVGGALAGYVASHFLR
ncbi:MAG: hypothetical protein NVS4B2_26410 [Chloroflexota bacterium]